MTERNTLERSAEARVPFGHCEKNTMRASGGAVRKDREKHSESVRE